MAAFNTVAAVAGTLISAGSAVAQGMAAAQQGKAAQAEANYRAEQARVQAGQERAIAQRKALNESRRRDVLLSNLQARAAASGAGALDPTVVDLAGDIAGEGEYRKMMALWEGEERARGLETGAGLAEFEGANAAAVGRAKRTAGFMSAGGGLLRAGASLYEKYGDSGPGEFEGTWKGKRVSYSPNTGSKF